MSSEDYAWELCKENFQPLKGGRDPKKHKRAFGTILEDLHTKSGQKRIMYLRNEWEDKLSNYDGIDILEVWMAYFTWIEDIYPELGEQSEIIPLLERCTRTLMNDQYQNDPRYLNVWLKYAEMCTTPLEIYTHLFKNQVCLCNAKLYMHWAAYLEDLGDLDSADKVIDKGLNMNAEPKDLMKKAQLHFSERMISKIKDQMKTTRLVEPMQRKTFGVLSKEEARTGLRGLSNPLQGNAPVIKVNKPLVDVKKTNFSIFDENEEPTKGRMLFEENPKLLGMNGYKPLAPEKERFKENTGIAEKWTNVRHKIGKLKTEKMGIKVFEEDDDSIVTDMEPETQGVLKRGNIHLDEDLKLNPLKFSK